MVREGSRIRHVGRVEHIRYGRKRAVVTALLLTALLVGGCGDPAFDPVIARPCDFLTAEEQKDRGFVLKRDEPDQCLYGFRSIIEHRPIMQVLVEYLGGDTATVASTLGVQRLAASDDEWLGDSRVEFAGSIDVDPCSTSGTCVMIAPIDDERVVVVSVRTDTSNVTWFQGDRIDDPCDYVAHRFEEIETKLRPL
ncbi:hypothetical protein ACN27F_14350 [Solwaraspora sp. WMMB335]|uniref:hypothetical protein n=1 Tax=Solwaraspora sp. WMMB335 TaxID=3404118 RepID=UPI003B93FFB1